MFRACVGRPSLRAVLSLRAVPYPLMSARVQFGREFRRASSRETVPGVRIATANGVPPAVSLAFRP